MAATEQTTLVEEQFTLL